MATDPKNFNAGNCETHGFACGVSRSLSRGWHRLKHVASWRKFNKDNIHHVITRGSSIQSDGVATAAAKPLSVPEVVAQDVHDRDTEVAQLRQLVTQLQKELDKVKGPGHASGSRQDSPPASAMGADTAEIPREHNNHTQQLPVFPPRVHPHPMELELTTSPNTPVHATHIPGDNPRQHAAGSSAPNESLTSPHRRRSGSSSSNSSHTIDPTRLASSALTTPEVAPPSSGDRLLSPPCPASSPQPSLHAPRPHLPVSPPDGPGSSRPLDNAASSPTPTALLVLGTSPTATYGSLSISLPYEGSTTRTTGPVAVAINYSHDTGPENRSTITIELAGPRSVVSPSRGGDSGAEGVSVTTTAMAAAAAAMHSNGSSFSTIWVNTSAQEELLLEAVDEYDSVLSGMGRRDPALAVFLKELARQMAAVVAESGSEPTGAVLVAAALPPAVTHLVPGGTPGMRLLHTSRSQTQQLPQQLGVQHSSSVGSSPGMSRQDSLASTAAQSGFTFLRMTPCIVRLQQPLAPRPPPPPAQQPPLAVSAATGAVSMKRTMSAGTATVPPATLQGAVPAGSAGSSPSDDLLRRAASISLPYRPRRPPPPVTRDDVGLGNSSTGGRPAVAGVASGGGTAAFLDTLRYRQRLGSRLSRMSSGYLAGNSTPVVSTTNIITTSITADCDSGGDGDDGNTNSEVEGIQASNSATAETTDGLMAATIWERPGLMVEHLSGDAQGAIPEMYERLQRDCSILSAIPAIITLFDLRGSVMHQNALSVGYLGYHRPPPPPPLAPVLSAAASRRRMCGMPSRGGSTNGYVVSGFGGGAVNAVGGGPLFPGRPSTLERLFELDPSKLSEMWAAVLDDRTWAGIVCVPGNLLNEEELGDDDEEEEERSRVVVGSEERMAGFKALESGPGGIRLKGGSAPESAEEVRAAIAAVDGDGDGREMVGNGAHLVSELPFAISRQLVLASATPCSLANKRSSQDGSCGNLGEAVAAAAGPAEQILSSGGSQRNTAGDLEGTSNSVYRAGGAHRSRLAVGSPSADADSHPALDGHRRPSNTSVAPPYRGPPPLLILPHAPPHPGAPESSRPPQRRMRRNSSTAGVHNAPFTPDDDDDDDALAPQHETGGSGGGGASGGPHMTVRAAAGTTPKTPSGGRQLERRNRGLTVGLHSTSSVPGDSQGRPLSEQEVTSLLRRSASTDEYNGQAVPMGQRPVVRSRGAASGSGTGATTVAMVRKRMSYCGGQRPYMAQPLHAGTWGQRGSPAHSSPTNAGLDLEAMTTSSWSLVVPPVDPGARRGTHTRHLRSYAGTPTSAGVTNTPDSSCRTPNSAGGQTPTGGKSTPLPRVVFFAAASVQRDSVRQKQQQEQQQQQRLRRRGSDTHSISEQASSSLDRSALAQQQQQQQPPLRQLLLPAQRPSTTGYPAAHEAAEGSAPAPHHSSLSPAAAISIGTDRNIEGVPVDVRSGANGCGGGSTTASDSDMPASVAGGLLGTRVSTAVPLSVASVASEWAEDQGAVSGLRLSTACIAVGDSGSASRSDTGPGDGGGNVLVSGAGGLASERTPLGALPVEVEAAAAAFLASCGGRGREVATTQGSASGGGQPAAVSGSGIGAASGNSGGGDASGGGAVVSMPAEAVHGGAAPRWHQVEARPFRDPVSRRRCILLVQLDVTAKVEMERRLAELVDAEHKILEQIFPRHVLEHMALDTARAAQRPSSAWELFRRDPSKLATKHQAVTILFADIKGFTNMCQEVQPEEVMTFLNELYNRFDTLLDVYGVYKVETIGDCYMVAGGLIRRDEEGFPSVHQPGAVDPLHAVRVMAFAKSMLREAGSMRLPGSPEQLRIRIGIHSGPVVSGVVGTRMPRFCLFGDTVNTASRMESTGHPGTIHVSEDTRRLLTKEMWKPTGGVQVKGKGLMHTFVWQGNQMEVAPHLVNSDDELLDGEEAPGGGGLLAEIGGLPLRCRTAPREDLPAAVAAALCRAISGTTRPRRSVTSSRSQLAHMLLRRGGVVLTTKGLFRLNVGRVKDKQRLVPNLTASRRERGEGSASASAAAAAVATGNGSEEGKRADNAGVEDAV